MVSAIKRLFEIISGGFEVTSDKIIIKTTRPITPELIREFLNEVTDLVVDSMLITVWPSPSVAKWTKTGPANDRIVLSLQCGILKKIVKAATKKLEFRQVEVVQEHEVGDSFLAYNAIGGIGKKTTTAVLESDDQTWEFMGCMLCNESYRYLALAHMHCNSQFKKM